MTQSKENKRVTHWNSKDPLSRGQNSQCKGPEASKDWQGGRRAKAEEAGGGVDRACKKATGGGVGPRSWPRRHEMWILGTTMSKEVIGLNLSLDGIFAAEMQI